MSDERIIANLKMKTSNSILRPHPPRHAAPPPQEFPPIRHSSFVMVVAFAILLSPSLVIGGAEPLRALLVTGGCCHDYEAQKKILSEGISARANVTWTIIHEGSSDSRETKFSIYNKPDWTKGFDVVVHNECSGFVTNVDWVEHIARGHFEGVPAVVIHC